MSFIASNDEFDAIFTKKSITALFLKKLQAYLEKLGDRFPYNELLCCMKNDAGLSVFACREDVSDDMYRGLLSEMIPCLRIATANGKTGFLIPAGFSERVAKLQRTVLDEKSYATRTNLLTGEQLLSGLLDPEKRDITEIRGLTKVQAYRLLELCQEKLLLSTSAIDEMKDGTYTFSLYQDDLLKSHNGVTISQIYLQMQLELAGPFAKETEEKTLRHMEMDKFIGHDFDIKTYNKGGKVFILGDKDTYMIIEEKRFEYGHIREKDGQRIYESEVKADKSIHNYPDQLRSFATRINNPRIFREERQFQKAELKDLSRTNQEIRYEIATGNVVKYIGEMLLERSQEDRDLFLYGTSTDILRNTIRESAAIFLAASGGNCPYEYTQDKIDAFLKIVKENHLNLHPLKSFFEGLSEVIITEKTRPIEMKHVEPVKEKGAAKEQEQIAPIDHQELSFAEMYGSMDYEDY